MINKVSLVILAAALASVAGAQPGGDFPVNVATARVVEGAFVQPLRLTGSVEAFRTSRLAAEEDGVVERLYVDEGDHVTTGTALLKLRTVPLELALARAEADAAAAEAALAELENGVRREEIEAARGTLEQANAQLATAERDYRRFEQLLKEKTASESEYDEAKQRYFRLKAEARTAAARLEQLENGARAEEIARVRATAAARRAEARHAADQLERATIRAPYEGTITAKNTEEGAWVGSGDHVLTIQSVGPVFVRVTVPEIHFTRLAHGDSMELQFESFPSEKVTGTVEQMIPSADPTSRAFPVRLLLKNEDNRLAPGMLARVVIEPKASGRTVVVPKDAIVAQGPVPVIYRVDRKEGDPKAERLEVTTGRYFGSSVEVLGSLNPGDEVVVRGNERLQPGAKLNLNQFLTNPDTARVD